MPGRCIPELSAPTRRRSRSRPSPCSGRGTPRAQTPRRPARRPRRSSASWPRCGPVSLRWLRQRPTDPCSIRCGHLWAGGWKGESAAMGGSQMCWVQLGDVFQKWKLQMEAPNGSCPSGSRTGRLAGGAGIKWLQVVWAAVMCVYSFGKLEIFGWCSWNCVGGGVRSLHIFFLKCVHCLPLPESSLCMFFRFKMGCSWLQSPQIRSSYQSGVPLLIPKLQATNPQAIEIVR